MPNKVVVDAEPLTEARWKQLLAVNTEINADVVPETDEQLYHVQEYWTYPKGAGDCEDYVLAKRRQLIELGWPASTLLITVVKQDDGEGHAVLMVRTDRGDLVLDNQQALIEVWNMTPYHYIKRQSQTNPGQWVDLYDNRPSHLIAQR
jgi:predicted transglutaminase-like cysteine proteinase